MKGEWQMAMMAVKGFIARNGQELKNLTDVKSAMINGEIVHLLVVSPEGG